MTATQPTTTTTNTAAALGRPGAAADDPHRGFRRGWVGTLVTHVCLVIGVVLSIFPFWWLLVMSTSTNAQIFGYPPSLWFGSNAMANVASVFANVDMLRALLNTVVVAGSTAVLVMVFDSLAAFAFAKYEFPFKRSLFTVMLATFLVPGSLSLVPSFVLMSHLGWIGGLQALIIPGAANAFGIFLLRQFATGSIPNEIIDSARVDGAGFFRTWWSIAVPMLRGGLAFLGIFTFITAWNDYVWPLIVLIDPRGQTLQVALAGLSSVNATDLGAVMAGAVISIFPLIGVFIIGSRHFIANIAAGALKG
ncbi:carbohydrate ABC transporter permease [Curtobacterium sp. VKM Ac-2922]|uniref:carbohydrate ABC transporter permease n=1 Tax=Curtobacterium sp. VKM Ac-2922 TaxID=2929475 RepID=UPI001FB4A092|nr:carbohydrate ABC transporter permease [Curtobacterium sp. VKM Ac-2922]MCJ1713571.1 carbohydrate ABC transporter permease [Curtobacterium sp. VKM Ac-2922]